MKLQLNSKRDKPCVCYCLKGKKEVENNKEAFQIFSRDAFPLEMRYGSKTQEKGWSYMDLIVLVQTRQASSTLYQKNPPLYQ